MLIEPPYNRSQSVFAGMTTAQLQAALATAQQAYLDLMSGTKAVSVSYTQGDGTKSVTYQMSSVANLTALIAQLQAQLGMTCRPRRPFRPVYRP